MNATIASVIEAIMKRNTANSIGSYSFKVALIPTKADAQNTIDRIMKKYIICF
jgi:hypothetical protein